MHSVTKEAPLLKTNSSTIALFLKMSKETGLLEDIVKAPSLSPSPPPSVSPREAVESGGRQAERNSLDENRSKVVNGMREDASTAVVGQPLGQSKKTPLLPPGHTARGGLLLGRQPSTSSQQSAGDPRPTSVSSDLSDASTDDSACLTVQAAPNGYSPSLRGRPRGRSPLLSEGSEGCPAQKNGYDVHNRPAVDERKVPLVPPATRLKRSESVQASGPNAATAHESRWRSEQGVSSQLRPKAFSRSVSLEYDMGREREKESVGSVANMAKPTGISATDLNHGSASPADNSTGSSIPSSRTQSVERDLAYENEALAHQIAHLKTHRVELIKENTSLRSMLRKSGEYTPPDGTSDNVKTNDSAPRCDMALTEAVPSTKLAKIPPKPPPPYISKQMTRVRVPSDECGTSSASGIATISDHSGRELAAVEGERVVSVSEPHGALQTVTPPSAEQPLSTEPCPVASKPIPPPRILGQASKNSTSEGSETKGDSSAHKPTPVPRSRAVNNLPAPPATADQGVASWRKLPKEASSSQESQSSLSPKPTPPPRPKSLPKGQYKPTISKPRKESDTSQAHLKTEAVEQEQPQAVLPNSHTDVEIPVASQGCVSSHSCEAASNKTTQDVGRPPKPPPSIQPCTTYKKITIMSDKSWIKKVRSESESSDLEQSPTVATPMSAPAAPARPRPPAPYRSVSIPCTPSPPTPTPPSVPPPFRPGTTPSSQASAPPPSQPSAPSPSRPSAPPPSRPSAPPLHTSLTEPGLSFVRRPASEAERLSPSKHVFNSFRQSKSKSPVSDQDDRGLTRSSSDDSLTSSTKLASKSSSSSPSRLALVLRAVKAESVSKKPSQSKQTPLSEGVDEGDGSRPLSMIARSSMVSGQEGREGVY